MIRPRRLPPRELALPVTLAALAAIAVLVVLLRGGPAIWATRAAAQPTPVAQIEAAATVMSGGPDLSSLGQSTLFGEPAAPSTPPATVEKPIEVSESAAPDDLPQASLGVTLQGVLYRERSTLRRAFVGGAGDGWEAYRIGDRLPGDALIRFIEPRRIVVEQAGKLQELVLREATLPGTQPSAGAAPQEPVALETRELQ